VTSPFQSVRPDGILMNPITCSTLALFGQAKDDFGRTSTCKFFPWCKKLQAATCWSRFSISNCFKWIQHVLDWHVVCLDANTTRDDHLR
jgi:hypothetical protein